MYNKLSVEDLRMMFEESIVLYKKYPVYVGEVHKDSLTLFDLGSKKQIDTVSPDHPEFDFKPVHLGCINLEGLQVAFMQRVPMRQFKIGLVSNNTTVVGVPNALGLVSIREAWKQPLADCILGKYPSKEEAIKAVEGKKKASIAFNRVFSIDQDLNLYHRNTKVGMINDENGKELFHSTKKYLKVLLD